MKKTNVNFIGIDYEKAASHILEHYTKEDLKRDLEAMGGDFKEFVKQGNFLVYDDDVKHFLIEARTPVPFPFESRQAMWNLYSMILEIAYHALINYHDL